MVMKPSPSALSMQASITEFVDGGPGAVERDLKLFHWRFAGEAPVVGFHSTAASLGVGNGWGQGL